MGHGDQILGTGLARGFADRGKRAALGDGRQILWDKISAEIFAGNKNIAAPGSEGAPDLEWIAFYKGNRLYNSVSRDRTRWVWNMEFRPTPGEIFFAEAEKKFASQVSPGFVLIEPNVPAHKTVASNKQWMPERFQAVADRLRDDGHRVLQLQYPGARYSLDNVERFRTDTFRHALAVLARSALYIGGEGGLHHASAAVGIPAVVLFGSWIPPQVTGYDSHVNLTGETPACGLLSPCEHCREAMNSITVDRVYRAAVSAVIPRRLSS